LAYVRFVAMHAEPFLLDRPAQQRDYLTVTAPHASDITLVDVAAGRPFPCAPAGSVLLSSVPFGWLRGVEGDFSISRRLIGRHHEKDRDVHIDADEVQRRADDLHLRVGELRRVLSG
jgi:hypothetical protein